MSSFFNLSHPRPSAVPLNVSQASPSVSYMQPMSPTVWIAKVHGYSDSYQMPFAPELAYSAEKRRQMMSDERGEEFWACYKENPEYRARRFCIYSPGTCRPCDDIHIQRVAQAKSQQNQVAVYSPHVASMAYSSPHRMHSRYYQRSRNDWRSSRPCHQFVAEGICRFGDNCRFSHDPLESMNFQQPPPRTPLFETSLN